MHAFSECYVYSANYESTNSGFELGTNLSTNCTKGLTFYDVKQPLDRLSVNFAKYA